jgi:hypothetical protein
VEGDGINAPVKLPLATHDRRGPTNAKARHKRNIEYIRRIEKLQLVILGMLNRDRSELRCLLQNGVSTPIPSAAADGIKVRNHTASPKTVDVLRADLKTHKGAKKASHV